MTVALYARRKSWPLEAVTVRLRHGRIHATDCANCETKEGMIDRIERELEFVGPLTAEQRSKLLEIAEKCPVHRTLVSEIDIRTKVLRAMAVRAFELQSKIEGEQQKDPRRILPLLYNLGESRPK
jgi:uncharacterized OsmC-like protein